MDVNELEQKRFEHQQKVQLEELDLKKKELELKIQEQKSKRIFTPLLLSIIGGFVTIITGIALKSYDNTSTLKLEDRKFQSTVLLKATDAKTYDEFSDILVALQENGLLNLDSAKVARFRKKRFVASLEDSIRVNDSLAAKTKKTPGVTSGNTQTDSLIRPTADIYWTIAISGDKDLPGAQHEVKRSGDNGFKDVFIYYRENFYRTCVGKYLSYSDAVDALFDAKEKLNNTSYIVRFDKWCPNPVYDPALKSLVCK